MVSNAQMMEQVWLANEREEISEPKEHTGRNILLTVLAFVVIAVVSLIINPISTQHGLTPVTSQAADLAQMGRLVLLPS